ncbi:hypothetical protein ScPMuIL_013988 [Solemya velum]
MSIKSAALQPPFPKPFAKSMTSLNEKIILNDKSNRDDYIHGEVEVGNKLELIHHELPENLIIFLQC